MNERILIIVFSVIAIVVTVTWVILVSVRSVDDVPPSVTVIFSGILTGCITLAGKASHAESKTE